MELWDSYKWQKIDGFHWGEITPISMELHISPHLSWLPLGKSLLKVKLLVGYM